ncbi:hypothetical protein [Nocardia acidivorans]|uniref:hypothetical protein n=1 Tax=Nocardia acidivorans TaxID=404580 RepID=UPI00082EF48E|nr:hypothetical protein [Nocardia acidivorans]
MKPTATQLDDAPLHAADDPTGLDCDRGVKLGAGEQIWGIAVNLSHAANCDFAVHVMERLLATRATAPMWSDTASPARVDRARWCPGPRSTPPSGRSRRRRRWPPRTVASGKAPRPWR